MLIWGQPGQRVGELAEEVGAPEDQQVWGGRLWCRAWGKDDMRKESGGDCTKGGLWAEQWGAGGVAGTEKGKNKVPQSGKSRKIL